MARYKVYKWNGIYLQGDLVGECQSKIGIHKLIKKIHPQATLVEDIKPTTIWIDDPDGEPIGVVVVSTEETNAHLHSDDIEQAIKGR